MSKRRSTTDECEAECEVASIAALRKIKGKRPIPAFVRALRSEHFAVAKTATMGLCDRKAVVEPLRDLLNDPDPNLRWRACALTWFFMIRDFVPHLVRALTDPDPMVRAEAAWAMRCADSDKAAKALLEASKDPDHMTAHYASWILRRVFQKRSPRLPALKGKRIPDRPLRSESTTQSHAPADIADDEIAFEQFTVSSDRPVMRARRARAIKTDGHLTSTYRRSPAGTLVHIDGYPEPPLCRTDFRAVATKEALHIHIRSAYRNRDELASKHKTDGALVYTDNSVEVFIDPSGTGRQGYYQICLNTRNARFFNHVQQGAPKTAGAWKPRHIASTVRVERHHWNAELCIPFEDLELPSEAINKVWRLNVVRNARLPELFENTSWCDMGDYNAHQPALFGYLWLDRGNVINADASLFTQVLLPLEKGLPGWTVLDGETTVSDGTVSPVGGRTVMRLDGPIPFEEFEVRGEAQIRHQVRFLFSPDPENRALSYKANYINLLNEINVSGMRYWQDWQPPYPGHLSIFKEVYPRLTHSRWYDLAVRVRRDRLQCLLDGAIHMEQPTPYPDARYLGIGLIGGGKLRKLRIRPLD